METTPLTCPNCGFRFNYRYLPGASFTAVRMSAGRAFRCPKCGNRAFFQLTVQAPEAALPTFEDPVLAGLPMVLLVAGGVTVLLYAASLYLSPPLSGIARITIFAAWVLGAVVYVLYRSGRTDLRRVPTAVENRS